MGKVSIQELKLLEAYEPAVIYILEKMQHIPRYRSLYKNWLYGEMSRIPDLLYSVAYTNQISTVRKADAALASLRFCIRCGSNNKYKALSKTDSEKIITALVPVGNLIGAKLKEHQKTKK